LEFKTFINNRVVLSTIIAKQGWSPGKLGRKILLRERRMLSWRKRLLLREKGQRNQQAKEQTCASLFASPLVKA